MTKTERKLRSGEELTKSEWDEVLWNEKPERKVSYGRTTTRPKGKTYRFGKKYAKKN